MTDSDARRSPKQKRSRERYEKILDTAAKLFQEKGFDGTTTNEIAKRADMSIGSLYQYFGDKEGIVTALTDVYVEALKEVTANIASVASADVPTAVAVDRFVDPIVQFHLSHPEFRKLWLATDASPELRASMRAMDEEVLGRVRELIEERVPGIASHRTEMITTTMHLAVKSLLGLLGQSEDAGFKARAATEAKKMLVAYIEEAMREQTRMQSPHSDSER